MNLKWMRLYQNDENNKLEINDEGNENKSYEINADYEIGQNSNMDSQATSEIVQDGLPKVPPLQKSRKPLNLKWRKL